MFCAHSMSCEGPENLEALKAPCLNLIQLFHIFWGTFCPPRQQKLAAWSVSCVFSSVRSNQLQQMRRNHNKSEDIRVQWCNLSWHEESFLIWKTPEYRHFEAEIMANTTPLPWDMSGYVFNRCLSPDRLYLYENMHAHTLLKHKNCKECIVLPGLYCVWRCSSTKTVWFQRLLHVCAATRTWIREHQHYDIWGIMKSFLWDNILWCLISVHVTQNVSGFKSHLQWYVTI